jgi:hypothetical protein
MEVFVFTRKKVCRTRGMKSLVLDMKVLVYTRRAGM